MSLGPRVRARLALPFLAAAALLVAAPAARATFHLIKVREVYAGTEDDSYVELQMYAAGQSFLGGHSLTLYDAAGALSHSSTFSAGVAKSENQRTVLIGDSGVQARFGVAPDLVDPGLAVPAAGGAACWNAGGLPADCVAWGNFSGGGALQTATGTSAGSPASPGGIATGKAIRRSIAPGCPTLLEESDDSNVSSADFSEVAPAPRNDNSAIVESTCAGAPNTAIDERPPLHSNSAAAEFTYEAPTATGYECSLDGAPFAACPGGAAQEYTALADGNHTFQVRGVNASGPDPTPAQYAWSVDTVAPVVTIDSHPQDPGPGKGASFGFHAGEAASFQCSLVPAGAPDSFAPCNSGAVLPDLGDGEYTFAVRATDLATNTGAPVSFTWEVDNSLNDTTPPQTTLLSTPPDPSTSAVASFTYGSSEPGSSFECALDGAPFAPCPPTGISYAGLADGPHSFQVRATDPNANTDQTPAGYSFSVVVPAGPVVGTPTPTPARPGPAAPTPAPASPQTVIAGKPAAVTHDRTPSFRFRAEAAGARFECAIDRQALRPCHSPFTAKSLKPGRHVFAVRALVGGLADPSPAQFHFKIVAGGR